MKCYRDAVQKLSIEYARLVRENERLRGVIQSAANMLGDANTREFKKGTLLEQRYTKPLNILKKVPC